MKYKIDVVRIRENSIQLNGWVIGKTPESKAEFEVLDQEKKPLPVKYVATRRDDVSQIYYKQVYDRDYGFDIQFPYERGADYWLVIRCDGKTARVRYNEELIAKRASVAHKRMEKIKDLMNMETVHVALEFGKKHGLKALLLKSRHKLQGLDNDYDYGEWYELTRPKEEELAAQRETKFAKEPLLSIVIPAYKTPEKYLREMLDSILAQTYKKWEVCVANGSPKGEGAIVSRVMAEKTAASTCRSLGRTWVFPATPMRPWRWQVVTLSFWPTTTIPFRSMPCMRWQRSSTSTRTAMSSIPMKISWIWTAARCSTRISNRISTRTF